MADQQIHPPTYLWRGPWEWREPFDCDGEHFRTCSYCGSIHPSDLAAETDWSASWADRKYGWPHKFYVDVINRDPGRVYVVGSSNQLSGRPGWVNTSVLTPDQVAAAARCGYPPADYTGPNSVTRSLLFGTRRTLSAKLYTIHLCDPEVSDTDRDAIAERSGYRNAGQCSGL